MGSNVTEGTAVAVVVAVGTSVGVLAGEGVIGVGSMVCVKVGRKVFVGVRLGITVLEGVMDGVRVGVFVAVCDGILVGVSVASDLGPRVLVGGRGVNVK